MASDSSIDVKRRVDAVFSIANSLRGTYQSDKYKNVIIPMVIIRRLECAMAETRDAVCDAYEKSDCRMTSATWSPSQKSLANLLRNAEKTELDAS